MIKEKFPKYVVAIAILLLTFTTFALPSCKEKKFRESHRFYWLKGETCGYVDQETGDTVRVAMKYCTCCKH